MRYCSLPTYRTRYNTRVLQLSSLLGFRFHGVKRSKCPYLCIPFLYSLRKRKFERKPLRRARFITYLWWSEVETKFNVVFMQGDRKVVQHKLKKKFKKYFYMFKILILQLKWHLQSDNKCWKCQPGSEMQASTSLLMLLTALCGISVVTFKIHSWVFCFGSWSECGLFLIHTFLQIIPKRIWRRESRKSRMLQFALWKRLRWMRGFNPLKTKRKLLYLKTQFVPGSKHFSSRL